MLASLNDYQRYLYTRRLVIREIGSPSALTWYGVEYVVLVPSGGVMVEGDLSRTYFAIVVCVCGCLHQVYVDPGAGIQIFRLRQTRVSGE